MPRFQRPTGTHDILPEEQPYWEYVTDFAVRLARRAGFERIDVPIFEATELFARGIGATTDVVEKEMYTFTDKGGESLTLRPELTAGVVRAYIENGMHVRPQPVKLYSIGPVFRYDRPPGRALPPVPPVQHGDSRRDGPRRRPGGDAPHLGTSMPVWASATSLFN